MSATTVRSRPYRVAKGLRCWFTYRPGKSSIDCHWDPTPPDRLTGKALRAYRQARLEFASSIKERVAGANPLVVVETFDLTPRQVADLALGLAPAGGNA